MSSPITFVRGDTVDLDTFVLTRAGVAVNLANASITWTMKRQAADADLLAVVQLTVGDGITVAGDGLSASIRIPPAATVSLDLSTGSAFVSDVQVVEQDGRVSTPQEWLRRVKILQDVTHTATTPGASTQLGGVIFPLPFAMGAS